MKTQFIRLLDVLLLGPGLVAVGFQARLPAGQRAFLVGAGLATILYNGANFVAVELRRGSSIAGPGGEIS